MFPFLSQNNFRSNLFSTLLAIFPISFIAGNMIININIIILILATLIFLVEKYLILRSIS